jgi:hypoxanthine phosphoribosyltransferase
MQFGGAAEPQNRGQALGSVPSRCRRLSGDTIKEARDFVSQLQTARQAKAKAEAAEKKRVHGVRKRFLEQDAIDERMEALQKKRQKQGNDLQRWLKKIEGKKGDAARKALEMIVKEARQIALDEAAQE